MNILKLVTLGLLMLFSAFNYAVVSELRPIPKQAVKYTKVLTKEFVVSGYSVWKEASSKGFKFYQDKHQRGPLSGANLVGDVYFDSNANLKSGISQIIGATNMRVGGCETYETTPASSTSCWNYFHLFKGKKLNKYWRIKAMKILGVSNWAIRLKQNTDDAYVKIKVVKPAERDFVAASLVEITLIGPKEGRWQDAFNHKWTP